MRQSSHQSYGADLTVKAEGRMRAMQCVWGYIQRGQRAGHGTEDTAHSHFMSDLM